MNFFDVLCAAFCLMRSGYTTPNAFCFHKTGESDSSLNVIQVSFGIQESGILVVVRFNHLELSELYSSCRQVQESWYSLYYC